MIMRRLNVVISVTLVLTFSLCFISCSSPFLHYNTTPIPWWEAKSHAGESYVVCGPVARVSPFFPSDKIMLLYIGGYPSLAPDVAVILWTENFSWLELRQVAHCEGKRACVYGLIELDKEGIPEIDVWTHGEIEIH